MLPLVAPSAARFALAPLSSLLSRSLAGSHLRLSRAGAVVMASATTPYKKEHLVWEEGFAPRFGGSLLVCCHQWWWVCLVLAAEGLRCGQSVAGW